MGNFFFFRILKYRHHTKHWFAMFSMDLNRIPRALKKWSRLGEFSLLYSMKLKGRRLSQLNTCNDSLHHFFPFSCVTFEIFIFSVFFPDLERMDLCKLMKWKRRTIIWNNSAWFFKALCHALRSNYWPVVWYLINLLSATFSFYKLSTIKQRKLRY